MIQPVDLDGYVQFVSGPKGFRTDNQLSREAIIKLNNALNERYKLKGNKQYLHPKKATTSR